VTLDVDDARLDDPAAVLAADPQNMLRAVATAGAQVRMAVTAAREAGLERITEGGRPRAIVVAGMGGSGIAGDVLAAVAGAACPVPIVVHRGYSLPGWVGAADLVIAVSCSGATQETLSAFDEAARRGASLVGIGAAESPLAARCEQARAPHVPVALQLAPRATMWGLATPAIVTAARLGLLDLGTDDEALEQAATRLDHLAEACHPDRDSLVNPAKMLAVDIAGSIPMVWGAGQVGPVAATRMSCQLAENAKYPAAFGGLPEAHHNQVVALDGSLAGGTADQDFFRDRVEDEQPLRLRLLLLHDVDGDDAVTARVEASAEIADGRGVPVTRLVSSGSHAVERLASLVGVIDHATVYLAVLHGIDPTPVGAIDELKARLSAL
jgi:glucose/mannose-6-phosphate isomerase